MSFFDEEVYKTPEAFRVEKPMAFLSGKDIFGKKISQVPINDMHVLVLGAPGMGKTVQIRKLLSQTVQNPNSTHIIFDPKGEFYREFYREGQDYALSLFDVADIRSNVRWNLMQDAACDLHPETTIREIAKSICKEAVTRSQNPFFPEAAEALISAIWIMVYRRYKGNLPNNDVLISKTKSWSRERLLKEASRTVNGVKVNDDLFATINELTDPKGGVATANIRQEMENILDHAFNPEGNFCSKGGFSVIDFVRNSKGRRLFLIYDFATAESSRQIIGTLLNLMMKESLSINASRNSEHRTYYYLDELPVLPDNISHLQSLCCFGRSTGNRVIVGIQGLSQLYHAYGENNGNAILAAFTDNIIMRANDPITVEKISRRSGQKTVTRTRMGSTRGSIDSRTEQIYAIPEDVMSNLDVGQAILAIRGNKPFYIELDS
ncbi:MAG: type IV secretion system DNA-binding domain-containing protein [Oscillospiraceae bacterium]|nr:type IV secretion system DNA-binding domain-containing protein [Oscillospiraceae bacterium]